MRNAFTMSTIKYIKPTESELEILQVLWDRGLASVREVHEELSKTKDAGYTTTLKLMQIMHEKGLVKRDDSIKTHIYQPAVSREKTQKHLLGKDDQYTFWRIHHAARYAGFGKPQSIR